MIFVNDVNKCYKLKLFLQQFFISAAVLNSEVPLNSRTHMLEEFNRGVFDYLIATDASIDQGEEEEEEEESDDDEGEFEIDEDEEGEDEEEEDFEMEEDDDAEAEEDLDGEENDDNQSDDNASEEEEEEEVEQEEESKNKRLRAPEVKMSKTEVKVSKAESKAKAKAKGDADYGVSRGIDFQGVSFVINFDFPVTPASYTHRIGRTARGGASGTSLSFVSLPESTAAKDGDIIASRDADVLSVVRSQQPRLGTVEGDNVLAAIGGPNDTIGDREFEEQSRMQPAPLNFNMTELESFRYRVEDTCRSVTLAAVKEFRTAELKREILNSTKLRAHFSENPNDLKVSRTSLALKMSVHFLEIVHPQLHNRFTIELFLQHAR